MIRRSLTLLLIALGIAGCASVPLGDAPTDAALKQFSTRPDVAGVYIYVDEWMGAGQRANVEIDGKPFGQNASLTYLYVQLAPGRHKVTVKAENADTLEFDAEGTATITSGRK